MKLYLDITNGRLVTSPTDATPIGSLPIHQGDIGEVKLVLLEAGSNLASPFTVVQLPEGFTKIKLGARLASNLMEDELLFSAVDWELTGTGASSVYTAPLNRETSGIAAAFPDENQTLRSVEALLDIQFSDDGLTVKETPLKQWPVVVTRDMVRDTEGTPTSGNPPLNSLEVVTTIEAGSLKVGRAGASATEGSLEILNGGGTAISPHSTVLKTLATTQREVLLPNEWGTVALTRAAQNWTGEQTFADGKLKLAGSSSGTATIKAPATGGGTATLPQGDGTLVYGECPFGTAEVSITGAVTLTSSAFGQSHVCTGTSANYSVTLPAAAGNAGKLFVIRMSMALTRLVTITAAGSDTIDGVATRVLWAGESATLFCTGTGWVKIGGRSIPLWGHGYGSSGTSVPTGTNVRVSLGTGAAAAPGIYGSNRLTAVRPARWSIAAMVSYESAGSTPGAESYVQVWKNGSVCTNPAILAVVPISTTGGNLYAHPAVASTRDMTTGDYLELYGIHTAGVTMATRTAASQVMPHLTIVEIPTW